MKSSILFGTVLMMGAAAASAKSAHVAKKKDAHATRATSTSVVATHLGLAKQVEETLRLRQAATHAEPVLVELAPVVATTHVEPAKTLLKDAAPTIAVRDAKEESATTEAKGSPALKPLPSLVRVAATTKEVVAAPTPATTTTPAVVAVANKALTDTKCVTRYSVAFGHGDSAAVPVNVCGDKLGKLTQKLLRAEGTQGHALDSNLALRLSKMLPTDKGSKAVRFDVLTDSKTAREKSPHADGRAIDIRPTGVSLKQLADACKKLDDTGCGAYPEGGFLHVDLREPGAGNVSWVDASRPGEAPKYVAEWPKNR